MASISRLILAFSVVFAPLTTWSQVYSNTVGWVKGSGSVNVPVTETGAWIASSDSTWITPSVTSGSGNASVTLNYTYTTPGSVANVEVASDDFKIMQLEDAVPEIDLEGGPGLNVPIASGDITPATADGTDFGQAYASGSVTKTFEVNNTGTGALTLGTATSSNPAFTVSALASSVGAGSANTFVIAFNPSAPGVVSSTITIPNSDSNENPYNFRVRGTGIQDDYGNTAATADGSVASGGGVSGSFEFGADVDFFRVEVPTQAIVSFSSSGGISLEAEILAGDGITVLHSNVGNTNHLSKRIFLQKGTYYVSLKPSPGVSGIYNLDVDILVHSDMDGDNRTDLILQHASNNKFVYWYLGDDGSTFGSVGGGVPLTTLNPSWQIVANGDFDFDMSNDLVLQNENTGQIVIWLMEDTDVVGVSSLVAAPGSAAFQVVGTHHFNDDMIPDILWQRDHDGIIAAWLMGQNSVLGSLYPPIQVAPIWKLADTADMNLDGLPDAVWQHTGTGMTAVWYLNDSLGFVPGGGNISFQPPSAIWQLTSVEDVNMDGNPDVIYQHKVTGNLVSYLLDGLNVIGAKVLSPQLGTPAWKLRNSRDLE